MKRHALCALLLLLSAAPLAAQQSTSIRLQSVDVPVTVLDAEGNPVRNLTAASFDLLEDGKRQALTNMKVVDFTAQPAGALAPILAAGRRQFLLVLDLGVTPAAREREQELARRFVKDVALPRDLVAVASIDSGRGFRLLSAFTTDRELTGSALDDPRAFRGVDPLQIANQSVIVGGSGTAGENTPPPPSLTTQVPAERLAKLVDAAGQLASAMRRVPGRKQFVLFTEDDDTNAPPHETATRNCRNADVVLHVVNAGTRTGALSAAAIATGGEVLQGNADLAASFARVLRRQEVVYVVTYDSILSDNAPGKFHEVSIRVPNVPHANVLHRTGVYEPGNESGFERVVQNAEIVVNDVPREDIHSAVLAAGFPGTGASAQVPVIVDINGNDLLAKLTSGVPVDVFIYAFDSTGVVRDRIFQRMTVDPAKTTETLRKGGMKYVATLSLPPGRYAIRTLVTTGDAKSFTRVDTDVRAAKQTALLPPLFFDDPSRWLLVHGASHAGAAPYPFQLNGEPFVPSARASVQNGRAQKIAVFVLNAAPNDLVWQMSVTDAAGRAHPASPAVSVLQGESVSKLVFDYTPAGLQAGAATATFSIMKRSSNESQRSSAAMVVVQ